MSGTTAALREAFGARLRERAPLAPMTTFRIGGPADLFLDSASGDDVKRAVVLARAAALPVTVLGGGSNVLVADAGVRGLVIRLRRADAVQTRPDTVEAGAGLTINGLVRWTIARGVAGLEAWAGTPGTVGGAVYGNAHYGGRNIGDLVETVTLLQPGGTIHAVPAAAMEFGYDYSRLHHTREIVLAAEFRVGRGNPAQLREIARQSLAYRKRTQPLASSSAGCIFQNPDPRRDGLPEGIPWSAGALVDRAGLKGAREGGARVSEAHANFIVNEGAATASDVRRLVERCKREVRDRFGVQLREEIVYLGFDEESAP